MVLTLPPSSKVSRTHTRNEKYCKMLSLSQKLVVVASECGMPEFRRMYSTVKSLLSYWERNVSVILTPVSDEVSLNCGCGQVHVYMSYMFMYSCMHELYVCVFIIP